MIHQEKSTFFQIEHLLWLIPLLVLVAAILLGPYASIYWVALLIMVIGAIVLLKHPVLGLFALIAAALLLPLRISTGTAVNLYPTALLVPALLGLWLLLMLKKRSQSLVSSRTNLPLILFVLSGLLSLGIGTVFWDPNVPHPGHFVVVQIAQWAIFAFSAGAFWLVGNWVQKESVLYYLTFFFLGIGGVLAIGREVFNSDVLGVAGSGALIRAPFWVLLFAVAGGQLLFNRQLRKNWQLFLLLVLAATLLYAFGQHDERASNWVGITAAAGILLWLRFPRLGWISGGTVLLLLAAGILLPILYEFAGGDARWFESGGARIALIERTIEVTMRNPITGLGPAAYRHYAATSPLIYEHIIWFDPQVSSHNNYVDIFSHMGVVGLGLFLWFMAEVARLGWHLRSRFQTGFAAGFVNSMLATWAGMIVIMMLLDWFLPFVYNVQFLGFQASVLVWFFLGGLVSLEAIACREDEENKAHAT